MIKKTLSLLREFRFFCFSIFILLVMVQKSYPLQSPPGLVVLPFAVDSNLVEIRNSFTDLLITKIKDAGYNAIGTRYLSSVLKMGSCESDECMRKIASLVGARYVIFGSIKGDTNSYRLSVLFKDLMESKVLLNTDRLLSGPQASIYYVDDLVLLIFRSLKTDGPSDSSDLPILNAVHDSTADSVSKIQPQSIAQLPDTTIPVKSDSNVIKTTDTSLEKTVLADSTENSIPINKALVLDSDTSLTSSEDNVSSIQPAIQPEQNEKKDIENTYSENIARSNIPVDVYIPPIKEKKTLVKPLPRQLDQQFFRGARLLVFGNTALAGLIGGLIMNDRVKKGLDKEIELYHRHENADREHLETTYDSYKRQTEKTDRDTRIRNAIYAVSGVCAVGFSISIFF